MFNHTDYKCSSQASEKENQEKDPKNNNMVILVLNKIRVRRLL